jgi:DNA polymerase III epsilon subunit-like protein
MSKIVFVDTETTGLDPQRHKVWEIAAIVRQDGEDVEWEWMFKVDLSTADPTSLRLNRYYGRNRGSYPTMSDAAVMSRVLGGGYFAGANPSFDAGFLEKFLRTHGHCPTWHHRKIDIESMAMTVLGWDVPQGLSVSALALGIEFDESQAHTALADARLARDIYDTIRALESK